MTRAGKTTAALSVGLLTLLLAIQLFESRMADSHQRVNQARRTR